MVLSNLLDGESSHYGPSMGLLSIYGMVPQVPILVTLWDSL
jgi:hypothetical protein